MDFQQAIGLLLFRLFRGTRKFLFKTTHMMTFLSALVVPIIKLPIFTCSEVWIPGLLKGYFGSGLGVSFFVNRNGVGCSYIP